jgi:hypothetical protein
MTRGIQRFLAVAACIGMCFVSEDVAFAGQRGGGHGNGAGSGHRQMRPVQPAPAPALPSINRPSFPIEGLNRPSFPLTAPLGFGPATPSPFTATPRSYSPRAGFPSRGPRAFGIPLGYGFGTAGYADTTTLSTRPAGVEQEINGGTLFLDVTPRTASVFIDTAYVGTVDDLFFNGVTLSRGRHWLELEATEREKKLVEIDIAAGQPLRYRADLEPARRAALTVIPPRPPETMYAIPGCYGGNKPPVAAALPAGCDVAKVRVLRPQQR